MTSRRRLLEGIGLALCATAMGSRVLAAPPRYRIGILLVGSATTLGHFVDTFKQAMDALGYEEGRNVEYLPHWAEGRSERLPALAEALVRLDPDVILAAPTTVALVARQATRAIPIVMATGSDPVAHGLAQSLARPGGNVTGLSNVSERLLPKKLELLRIMVPKLRRVCVLGNPRSPGYGTFMDTLRTAAVALHLTLVAAEADGPATLPAAFDAVRHARPDGLLVLIDPVLFHLRRPIIEFAAQSGLPAIYSLREYVADGGLMSYGSRIGEGFRRAAGYVDRILRGANPAEMPIEDPAVFELVINRRTAAALGLPLPRELMARVDEIID